MQHVTASAADAVEHRRWPPPWRFPGRPQTGRGLDPHDRQAPLGTGPGTKVELPRVEGRGRPQSAAEYDESRTHAQVGGWPIDHEGGMALRRLPVPAVAHRSDGHHAFARRPTGSGLADGRRRERQEPRGFQHGALDRHRLRRVGETPGQVIARKQVVLRRRPGGTGGDDSGAEPARRGSTPLPQPPASDAGNGTAPPGEGCPAAQRQRHQSADHTAHRQADGHHDERAAGQRLMAATTGPYFPPYGFDHDCQPGGHARRGRTTCPSS